MEEEGCASGESGRFNREEVSSALEPMDDARDIEGEDKDAGEGGEAFGEGGC